MKYKINDKCIFFLQKRLYLWVKKILVIFKTHIDIGFTDFSANVTEKYMNSFLPDAAKVASEMKSREGNDRFIWSTGSWFIAEYLRTHSGPEGETVRKGIENGDICWHGLPFTTHIELMSEDLFKYALSISQELDKSFGKKDRSRKNDRCTGTYKGYDTLLKKSRNRIFAHRRKPCVRRAERACFVSVAGR